MHHLVAYHEVAPHVVQLDDNLLLFVISSRARTADQTLTLLGILFYLRCIDDDFCYNLLSLPNALDDFGVYSVGLTDGYRMSSEGLVAEGPYLVLALAIHNLHILAHGFLGRSKTQSLVGYSEYATALLGVDGDIGCQTRLQLEVCIWSRYYHLVSNHIVGSSCFQAHLLYGSLEGVIRISINGEGNTVAFFHTADISLIHVCHYLHVGQVLGNGEEFWGVEACRYGLAFLYALRDNGTIDRRRDGSVAQVGLSLLYIFLG